MPSGLSRDETEALVKGIMEVDVGNGCREGRLRFIRDHLGDEWAEWAANVDKKCELMVLLVEYTNNEAYNQLSDHDVAEYIVEQVEGNTDGKAVVTHRRWDLQQGLDDVEIMNTVSRAILRFQL